MVELTVLGIRGCEAVVGDDLEGLDCAVGRRRIVGELGSAINDGHLEGGPSALERAIIVGYTELNGNRSSYGDAVSRGEINVGRTDNSAVGSGELEDTSLVFGSGLTLEHVEPDVAVDLVVDLGGFIENEVVLLIARVVLDGDGVGSHF